MTRAKDISKILTDADISGNIDVDGVTNLDVTDIDGTLNVAGETTLQTHLNMGDGDIIKLGASADLQIQHNGSGSYVSDSGTGYLFLQGAAQIRLQNPSGANYAIFADGGASTLYHNNSAKIATASGGVTVTGGVTTTTASSIEGGVVFNEASADVDFRVESNGNANMLFVDGGQDRVGINNNNPQATLHIDGSLRVQNLTSGEQSSATIMASTAGNSALRFADADDINIGKIDYNHADNSMAFDTNNTERMRIEAGGDVLIGKSSGDDTIQGTAITNRINQTTNAGVVMLLNRGTNDGDIVLLRQNNVSEGTISVSGTTVSYNGGHLSRWSQLTNNTRDNTIVKGTVMTNLDQMAEWTTDGVTEDNEQLNCMAVSSVEGDANVAGVFVNWDNDDDVYTNDMNVAMTGDMVIRIAQGTTVARGDLLISAGDGTAKTQDDDIVRSKTIAKVTSTNVSHTYADGTYLVPCVLMAC